MSSKIAEMDTSGDIDYESIRSGESAAAQFSDTDSPTYYQFFAEISLMQDPEELFNSSTPEDSSDGKSSVLPDHISHAEKVSDTTVLADWK